MNKKARNKNHSTVFRNVFTIILVGLFATVGLAGVLVAQYQNVNKTAVAPNAPQSEVSAANGLTIGLQTAVDIIESNGQVMQVIWGNKPGSTATIGESRWVPYTGATISWDAAGPWLNPTPISRIRKDGKQLVTKILATSSYALYDPNTKSMRVRQTIWDGEKGYVRYIPMSKNGSIQLARATAWGNALDANKVVPGGTSSSMITAMAEVMLPDGSLYTTYAKNVPPTEYYKVIPGKTVDGHNIPHWEVNVAWSSRPTTDYPMIGPSSGISGRDLFYQKNNTIFDTLWVDGHKGYIRTVPVTQSNGKYTIEWDKASEWSGPFTL